MKTVNMSFKTTYQKGINSHDGADTAEDILNDQFVKHLSGHIRWIHMAAQQDAQKINDDSVNKYLDLLSEFEASVKRTIQYELLNEDEKMQYVKVNFSFDYKTYKNCALTKLETFINFIMKGSMNNPIAITKDVEERFYHMPGANKLAADKYIAKLKHVGEMMKEANETMEYNAVAKKAVKKLKN